MNFRNKGCKVNYIDTLNGQEAEIYFPYLTGTIKIVCEIDLNMATVKLEVQLRHRLPPSLERSGKGGGRR